MNIPKIIIHDAGLNGRARWLSFNNPVEIITADQISDVLPKLCRVEEAVMQGRYAAGFLTYEAASAFEPALVAHPQGRLPLLWFGIYHQVEELPSPFTSSASGDMFTVSPWELTLSKEDYRKAINRIKDYIASGDTYQVNYTHRLYAVFSGDPWALFADLYRAQRVDYCAYFDLGNDVICSLSPELFFTRKGSQIICRPMKGTAERGLTLHEDEERAEWLYTSDKNRAENVMIVDMIRNDLGHIAVPGSIKVPRLFEVEPYDTLWQMTSTVTATSTASVAEIFKALFPCASITGAPKIRTSRIIAELEDTPRGIYTGAIGFIMPGGDAQFNVAIRTAHLDRSASRIEYGTGGGVTWGSGIDEEYEESLVKARVLTASMPEFQLLETMLWKPESGYFLLGLHLQRLADSTRYFGFEVDLAAVEARLKYYARTFPQVRQRVRILVDEEGAVTIEATPLVNRPNRRWRIAFAKEPIDHTDRFLYHKTTNRGQYENARAALPGVDDVILWNTRGEVTESTIANVVIRYKGKLLTPPVSCGLLAGVYRQYLLDKGRIEEAIISHQNLEQAEAVYLINSVRGWIPVDLELK